MDRRISHSQYPLELRLLAEILDVSNHSFIYDDMLDFDVWTAPFSFRTVLGATWEMLRVPGSQGFAFLAKDLPGFRLSGSQVCFADTNTFQKVGYVHTSPRCKSYKNLLTSMNSFSAGAQQRERWAWFIFPRPQPLSFLQRVVLSALYLGVGPKEVELVSKLQGNLASNPQLRVNFLLDCCRGRFSFVRFLAIL